MIRTKSGAAVIVAVLALTACSTDGTGPSASPAPTSTTGEPAPSASAQEATIPAAALLQAADLGGVSPEPARDAAQHLRPPRPCSEPNPSDSARVSSTAVTAALTPATGQQGTPSVILETIVRYRHSVGPQAFSELTTALRRCPGELGKNKRRWEVVGDLRAGDEAILFRTTTQFVYGDETNLVTTTTPVGVARVGDDIVLVADLGWETTGGDESRVRRLVVTAVERLRAAT
jgi:hypothetical protein